MIAGIETVGADDDIMLITSAGTIIRTPAADIPEYSRTAGGVIVMRTGEDAGIVNFTCLPAVEDEPDEPEETAAERGVGASDIGYDNSYESEGEFSPDVAEPEDTVVWEDTEEEH